MSMLMYEMLFVQWRGISASKSVILEQLYFVNLDILERFLFLKQQHANMTLLRIDLAFELCLMYHTWQVI